MTPLPTAGSPVSRPTERGRPGARGGRGLSAEQAAREPGRREAHTALTNFGLGGTDPFSLQKIAGHADLKTTLKYVHAGSESMKRAYQKKAEYERGLKKKVLVMPAKRTARGKRK